MSHTINVIHNKCHTLFKKHRQPYVDTCSYIVSNVHGFNIRQNDCESGSMKN